jgi:hypothetical protein
MNDATMNDAPMMMNDSSLDAPSSDAKLDVFIPIDAPSDAPMGNDSGLMCPNPANLNNFMPPAYIPPNAMANVCSAPQMQGFYDDCLDPMTSSPAKCNIFKGINKTCAACLESSSGDPSWGALILDNTVQGLNVAGCVAYQGDLACAKALENQQQCEWAGCDMVCPVSNQNQQSFQDYEKCITTVINGGCKTYTNAVQMTCSTDAGSALSICRNFMSFKDGYAMYAPMFCGGGG